MLRHCFPLISGNQADKGKLCLCKKKTKNRKLKSLKKKKPMPWREFYPRWGQRLWWGLSRTNDWFLSLSFLLLLIIISLWWGWAVPGVAGSVGVVPVNPEKRLLVHRGKREADLETSPTTLAISKHLSSFWDWKVAGTLGWHLQICTPNEN